MHEGHFTDGIVDAILAELKDRAGQRASRVKVRVGEMCHLEPESVRLHFETRTLGTPLEGAELELEEVPVRVRCRQCGSEGAVEDHHMMLCTECGSTAVELLDGNQVYVTEIDVSPCA